jgi:L-amino acid N-acyltransferase YncA
MSTAPAEIALRAAQESDLAAVTAIYALHVRTGTASFEVQPPDEAEMGRRWRDVVERGWPYLVALSAGRVVGFAYAGAYRPRPAYRFTVEDSVYVENEARGRGLGRALLGALIEAAETAGARQMIAVIGDSANAASVRLHASLGFSRVGLLRSVGRKFERWLDVVLMQRELGPGDRADAE